MFDLDLLPTFLCFTQHLSFTLAARELGLTQPAVHGQVKRLAAAVEDPLYVRTGRSLALTPRGVELAALAHDILQRRDHFLHQQPPLRLAAGRGTWMWLLTERLGSWLHDHAVQPVLADGPAAEAAVRRGEAELGISTAPAADFDALPMWVVHTDLLVPKHHALCSLGAVHTRDLAGLEWVRPSPGKPHRVAVDVLLGQHGLAATTTVCCDDWALAARFVRLGLGVAAVNDFVEAPGVVRLPWLDGPRHTYSLFWRPTARPAAIDAIQTGPTS